MWRSRLIEKRRCVRSPCGPVRGVASQTPRLGECSRQSSCVVLPIHASSAWRSAQCIYNHGCTAPLSLALAQSPGEKFGKPSSTSKAAIGRCLVRYTTRTYAGGSENLASDKMICNRCTPSWQPRERLCAAVSGVPHRTRHCCRAAPSQSQQVRAEGQIDFLLFARIMHG